MIKSSDDDEDFSCLIGIHVILHDYDVRL